MSPLIEWLLLFWGVTLVVLLFSVLASRLALVAFGPRGIVAVFIGIGLLIVVGTQFTGPSGTATSLELIVAAGLFLTISLSIVAIPLYRLGAGVTAGPYLRTGLVAAIVSTLIAPFLFLALAVLTGDGP